MESTMERQFLDSFEQLIQKLWALGQVLVLKLSIFIVFQNEILILNLMPATHFKNTGAVPTKGPTQRASFWSKAEEGFICMRETALENSATI